MVKVSIITRTKDRPLLLNRAITSILNQSYTNYEHIIINDSGDVDVLNNLVSSHKEKYENRVKVIHNKVSQGMEFASNIGVDAAEGEYIIIHDDDDSWDVDFLKKTVEFLDNNKDFDGVVTDITYFVEEILEDKVKLHQKYTYSSTNPVTIENLFFQKNYPSPICFLFRKKCIDEIGKFNAKLLKYGDREFFLRFLKKYKIANITEPLANYHARPYSQKIYANSTLSNDAYKENSYWEKKLVNQLFLKNIDLWLFYQWMELKKPYVQRKGIKKILNNIKGSVVLYGAGMVAEGFLKNYKKDFCSLEILGFVDQNSQKHGHYIGKYKIFSTESLEELNPDNILITVANPPMVKPLIEELKVQAGLDCKIVSLL